MLVWRGLYRLSRLPSPYFYVKLLCYVISFTIIHFRLSQSLLSPKASSPKYTLDIPVLLQGLAQHGQPTAVQGILCQDDYPQGLTLDESRSQVLTTGIA